MSDTSYVYVGYDGTGFFKIGITGSPKGRIAQIRTGNPTFTFLWCFECEKPQVKELLIHNYLEEKRISGEWFDLSPDDLSYIYNVFFPDQKADWFETWDFIKNKKAGLDKQHVSDSIAYWRTL